MHAYLIPIVTKIAGIYGPHPNWDCRHIWSPTKLLMRAYFVPTLTDSAGILGPPDIKQYIQLVTEKVKNSRLKFW